MIPIYLLFVAEPIHRWRFFLHRPTGRWLRAQNGLTNHHAEVPEFNDDLDEFLSRLGPDNGVRGEDIEVREWLSTRDAAFTKELRDELGPAPNWVAGPDGLPRPDAGPDTTVRSPASEGERLRRLARDDFRRSALLESLFHLGLSMHASYTPDWLKRPGRRGLTASRRLAAGARELATPSKPPGVTWAFAKFPLQWTLLWLVGFAISAVILSEYDGWNRGELLRLASVFAAIGGFGLAAIAIAGVSRAFTTPRPNLRIRVDPDPREQPAIQPRRVVVANHGDEPAYTTLFHIGWMDFQNQVGQPPAVTANPELDASVEVQLLHRSDVATSYNIQVRRRDMLPRHMTAESWLCSIDVSGTLTVMALPVNGPPPMWPSLGGHE